MELEADHGETTVYPVVQAGGRPARAVTRYFDRTGGSSRGGRGTRSACLQA